MLHRICNFLASIFLVGSVSKLSRTRDADARTGDSKSPCCRIESDTAKYLIIKAYFLPLFFLFLFIELLFVVFSLVFAKENSKDIKITKNVIDFPFRKFRF